MTSKSSLLFAASVSILLLSSACGGGSSGGSLVIEGTLIQGSAASHGRSINSSVAHTAGQTIESVRICALGQCSTTDANGAWGFATDFEGGAVNFTLDGHGILAETAVDIPADSQDVFIEFENQGGNHVLAHTVTIDGEEDHDHSHESEESHEH